MDRNTETARKILDAALALWNEKGYEQVTMRELARRLGMGVSSLYFYFSSKEEIVQYLYQQVNEDARARFLREDDGGSDLSKNFDRYLRIKLELLAPQRSCLAAVLKEAVDPESTLSPLGGRSAGVLRDNVEFLGELAARSGAADSAKLLWLVHIAVLVYWLHDRSDGAANSLRLVARLAEGLRFLPMIGMVPGSGELQSLLSAVLEPPAAPTPAGAAEVKSEAPDLVADVVVIGGGPIGVLYATFLKLERPKTSIVVLERAAEPGHKIGESTLSGFCKATRTVGVRHEAFQRLFYPKNGLGFFHVEESTRDLTRAPEYILESFDETFQVERRVLDSLLIANAERVGVQVIRGAQVQLRESRLSARGSVVAFEVGPRTWRIRASIVADASGPAGVLSRSLGTRTDDDVAFQTSSVWAYFSGIKPLGSYRGWRGRAQSPRDHYTQHLCFREGWLWYIPIVSWQGAPTANLERMLGRTLQSPRAMPSREELELAFACPTQPIVSVGLSLRADRDGRIAEDPRGAFEHYAKKYPAIRQLLDGARTLEDHYGPSTTFMSRLNYRGHARQVCGDGWLLVGDAAFFVDPLISPGLTGGTAGAYRAMHCSVKALDQGDFSAGAFAEYQAFVEELQPALERDNELVYMSFDHPEALALIQRFQEIDARRHFHEHRDAEYGPEDTNVWGILDPAYQQLQRAAHAICREEEERVKGEVPIAEQSPADYEPMVARLRALLGPYVEGHTDLTPYVKAQT